MHIALILAKSGSKGMPGKNLFKDESNHSLIASTIKEIHASHCFDSIYVSTNCNDIKSEALKYGAKVISRDDSLADNNRYVDSVYHALKQFERNTLTCTIIQVVQPLREEGIFKKVLSLHGENIDSVVTVTPFQSSIDWIFTQSLRSNLLSPTGKINYGGDIARRNDLFIIDNAIVSFKLDSARKKDSITAWPYLGKNIMPIIQNRMNMHYEVDINVPDDAEWFEFIQTYPAWRRKNKNA